MRHKNYNLKTLPELRIKRTSNNGGERKILITTFTQEPLLYMREEFSREVGKAPSLKSRRRICGTRAINVTSSVCPLYQEYPILYRPRQQHR